MGGRHAATTQAFHGKEGVLLAVAHPWASASYYLSSQALADSRCNPRSKRCAAEKRLRATRLR